MPCTATGSTPARSAGKAAATRPRASMAAVMPVLVAATMGRAVSMVRSRPICRCWRSAQVLPNQPRLLTLAMMVAPGRPSGPSCSAGSSSGPNRSS
ncbi:Uncharacterised protein [Bordetella pertussis]|nr:Uncharacterised protein [Bordetella pertussis]